MSFDGFFVFHLIKELNQDLTHARLEKINYVDAHRFLFSFYNRGKKFKLLISCDPNHFGAYLTDKVIETHPSNQFIITLKKHIEGSILEKITQHETDRVMIFHFKMNDLVDGIIHKELVFEAMGKHSNLILVSDQKIIDCHKKMFFEDGRQLLPQADFQYFPALKKPFTEINYETNFSSKDLVENYLGISPFLARYLYDTQVNLMTLEIKPTLNVSSNKFYVIDIFPKQDEKQYFETVSQLLDHFQPKKGKAKLPQQTFIDLQLKKFHKKNEKIELALTENIKGLDLKNEADLIYQSGIDLKQKLTSLDVFGQTITLDSTKTLNENAQMLYKKYQKSKRSIEHLKDQLKENQEMIDVFHDLELYLELSLKDSLKDFDIDLTKYGYKSNQKVQKQIKKKESKPSILTLKAEGAVYYVGKNSTQNQYITHTLGQKDDYWFHVKDAPGSHVLVKTKTLTEPIMRLAAMLAAYHSKLKLSSSIPVDYTQVKHLKKIPKKPLYTVMLQSYKTIYIDIDEKRLLDLLKTNSHSMA